MMLAQPQTLADLLSQYRRDWHAHVARVENKIRLLGTLKQGMELLLLVGSFVIYYLLDCFLVIMALPLPIVAH